MNEDGDRIADREKKLEENQELAGEKPELAKLLVRVNLDAVSRRGLGVENRAQACKGPI